MFCPPAVRGVGAINLTDKSDLLISLAVCVLNPTFALVTQGVRVFKLISKQSKISHPKSMCMVPQPIKTSITAMLAKTPEVYS